MAEKRIVEQKPVDMTKAEDMALNISWCVAEQTAGYLEIIMAGMTQEGINSLMHIIDEASGEVLVEIIKAVFIVNQMQEAENILIPLEICAKYCDDTYLYFYDCFCNTDIIDACMVDYWISKSEIGEEYADD